MRMVRRWPGWVAEVWYKPDFNPGEIYQLTKVERKTGWHLTYEGAFEAGLAIAIEIAEEDSE